MFVLDIGTSESPEEGEVKEEEVSEFLKEEGEVSGLLKEGEVSSQGCNISALTTRLEDAWRPLRESL